MSKLLLQAVPDRAYFGEKDFQQLQVIRRMVRDLNIPVAIVGVPTIREADGLAMSSRNRYLSPAQRKMASALPQIMHDTVTELRGGSVAAPIIANAKGRLHKAGFDRVDYLELCDEATLQPIPAAARLVAPVRRGLCGRDAADRQLAGHLAMDISLARIAAAAAAIDPVFRNSPQFVCEGLSAELARRSC